MTPLLYTRRARLRAAAPTLAALSRWVRIAAAEQQRRLARQRRQPAPDDLTAMRRWAAGAIHVEEATP